MNLMPKIYYFVNVMNYTKPKILHIKQRWGQGEKLGWGSHRMNWEI